MARGIRLGLRQPAAPECWRAVALTCGGLALCLFASPAWAAAAPTVAELWGAVAAALLALGSALWLLVRVRRAERLTADTEAARQTLARLNGDLAAFLDTVPLAFLRWGGTASVASPTLRRGLGLDQAPVAGVDDLAAAFDLDGGRRLAEAAARLEAEATPFELTLGARDGRQWRILGRRLAVASQPNVLWFEDATQKHMLEGGMAAALAEQRRLAELFQLAPIAAWQRDGYGAIVWRNAAFERVVGNRDGAELEGTIAPGQARALAERARQTGGEGRERRHYVVDGQRRGFEVVEIADRAQGGTIGFALDTTQLEEAEAALRRLQESQGEVLNQLTAAVAIFGPDKQLAYFNSAYARLWRQDEDWLRSNPHHADLLDRMIEQRLLPEEPDITAFRQRVLAKYRDLLTTEESLMYLPNDTTLRRVVAPHPMGGLIYVYEDVTGRLRLERSYNTLIAVQRETLDNLHEGVALFGTDGRLKLHNPAFQRIWNLEGRQLQSEPHVTDLVDAVRALFAASRNWPETREALIASAFERRARNGRVARPDGGIIDFASVPLPDGNILFTYVDVTTAASVERALRERNEALETAERLQREFLANVSYELRTPLNVIIGFSEMLLHGYTGALSERQQLYCKDILSSSHHLLDMINPILDLAGIEAGQLALDLSQFAVRPLLEDIASLTRERARAQDLKLDVVCPEDLGTLEADARRLKQALAHLVNNALKFTPRSGRIELGAEQPGDEVLLWVSDTGVGIPQEDMALVFEKFQRGRQHARRHGAGLGLSLVKSIVELHGGRVDIVSQVAVGTRVTCILPLARPPQQAAAQPAAA